MGQSGTECGQIISWQTCRTESSRFKIIKYLTRIFKLKNVIWKIIMSYLKIRLLIYKQTVVSYPQTNPFPLCQSVIDILVDKAASFAGKLYQGYRYHKLQKTFSKFYRRRYELVSKFNAGLKTLLHQGLSEPEFYGDLVYKFKIIVGT